jgi:hypothetical protein
MDVIGPGLQLEYSLTNGQQIMLKLPAAFYQYGLVSANTNGEHYSRYDGN